MTTSTKDPAVQKPSAIQQASDALSQIRWLLTAEHSLTFDEMLEHIEQHADIGIKALASTPSPDALEQARKALGKLKRIEIVRDNPTALDLVREAIAALTPKEP